MCANWVNETRGTAGGVKDGKTWFFGKIILLGRTYNKIHLTFSCVHMSMVYNNALYASMQILEEYNSLCLLPSFNKICWLSLTNTLSIISLPQFKSSFSTRRSCRDGRVALMKCTDESHLQPFSQIQCTEHHTDEDAKAGVSDLDYFLPPKEVAAVLLCSRSSFCCFQLSLSLFIL